MAYSALVEVSFSNKQLIELPIGTKVCKEIKPLGYGVPAIPMTFPDVPEGQKVADMPHQTYELIVHTLTRTDATIPDPRATFDSPEFLGFYCHVPMASKDMPLTTMLYAFFLYPLE